MFDFSVFDVQYLRGRSSAVYIQVTGSIWTGYMQAGSLIYSRVYCELRSEDGACD